MFNFSTILQMQHCDAHVILTYTFTG